MPNITANGTLMTANSSITQILYWIYPIVYKTVAKHKRIVWNDPIVHIRTSVKDMSGSFMATAAHRYFSTTKTTLKGNPLTVHLCKFPKPRVTTVL